MALIPAGSFTMGDSLDGDTNALPLHTVNVSAFYMDKYDVTKASWDSVYQWATNHGYSFDYAGLGKGANDPVQTIDWWDAVKWSNARSEQAGLNPCYYTSAGQTVVYRNGQLNLTNACVNWGANGYRLPTEAEWEKAARGGASRAAVPVGQHDFVESGELLRLSSGLRLRCESNERLQHQLHERRFSLHESGGVFCAERVRALRHGRERIAVVLGLV